MLKDYFTYDGIEMANAKRAFVYSRNLDVPWVEETAMRCPDLFDGVYTDPATDDAPWYDPATPDTAKFCGVIVTSVGGGEDSTHEAQVYESVLDGGSVSPSRHSTRTLVFTALLVGQSEAAVTAGLGWLENLLHGGNPCRETPRAPGEHPALEFYTSCPYECAGGEEEARRVIYDAHLVRGPLVIANPKMSRGALMEVTFTVTSHNPYVWGQPYSVTDDIGQFDYDFLAATYSTYNEVAGAAATYDEFVEVLWHQYLGDQWGGSGVGGGTIPSTGLPDSFFDPDCSPLPTFPALPQTTTLCRDLSTTTWQRAAFVIGRSDVPEWAQSLPRLTLTALTTDHKDVRIRFTPGTGDPDTDYSTEWLVSYLPAGGALTLDGPKDRIDLSVDDVTARAAHLVTVSSYDGQHTFPVIRCGVTYLVTIDIRTEETQSDVDVAMSLIRRDY